MERSTFRIKGHPGERKRLPAPTPLAVSHTATYLYMLVPPEGFPRPPTLLNDSTTAASEGGLKSTGRVQMSEKGWAGSNE